MGNETVRYSRTEAARSEYADDDREYLLWRNSEVRKASKDLLLNAEELPDSEQYKARLVQLINEILALVPALDPERETADERDRQELAESIERSRQQWKANHQ